MTARPSTYTTKQGKAILDFLQTQKGRHLTAAEIATHFASGDITLGRTTVYRQLDKLANSGMLKKYILNEISGACFQYVDEEEGIKEHFHLKCEECGILIHVDGDRAPCVEKDIFVNYEFEVNVGKTVFYGKCRACSRKACI